MRLALFPVALGFGVEGARCRVRSPQVRAWKSDDRRPLGRRRPARRVRLPEVELALPTRPRTQQMDQDVVGERGGPLLVGRAHHVRDLAQHGAVGAPGPLGQQRRRLVLGEQAVRDTRVILVRAAAGACRPTPASAGRPAARSPAGGSVTAGGGCHQFSHVNCADVQDAGDTCHQLQAVLVTNRRCGSSCHHPDQRKRQQNRTR